MTASGIPETIIAAHGVTPQEYRKICDLIGRHPNFTELGIFSAMWNEHCSYKSSKKWLRMLPTSGPKVVQGPGENAGIVDIGDGDCLVFKMESHNHPSYIEPFQGAATGTGGILRDIFTMGARPVAVMNALRFGEPGHPRTKTLVAGVVSGIGSYANAFGVPTVGGEVNFDADYNNNCLVNAFAAGIVKKDRIFFSKPTSVGQPVIYLGAATGRDGIGGATMASTEFDTKARDKRHSVQIGDPFKAKCLLEACMELMEETGVIAIQDMGAAGLTCSAAEMAAKGNLGIEIDLDKVPLREKDMSSYEIMLSESQERMLLVLEPEHEKKAKILFAKWGLDCSVIGCTTRERRLRILHKGKEAANLPVTALVEEAPEYDRPWHLPEKSSQQPKTIETDINLALIALIGGHHLSSRRWVWEQYDTLIQSNSLQTPGGDAGVIRTENSAQKALAFSCDSTPRYCKADPYEGACQAVSECWRNLTATGAVPLAATDNLNFGNPEKPEIMGQFVSAIKGISDACQALDFPIVSGNVSFYNETNDQGIPPSPVITGVGLIEDRSKMMTITFTQEDQTILLIGAPRNWGRHLGQSLYLRDIQNCRKGPPPPVNLAHERKTGNFIRSLIQERVPCAVHDLSDGGLAIALVEMILASNIGATILQPQGSPTEAFFGEDQGRYLLITEKTKVEEIQQKGKRADVSVHVIGYTGGTTLKLGESSVLGLHELRQACETWFPDFMKV